VTFGENKIYGLLGNNGAGKTTLLNVITNRLFPDSGLVTVDGLSVSSGDGALGKLFMTGEQNMYPEEMRVGRAFRVGEALCAGFSLAYAEQLAERFGLNRRSKIKSLSTGYASIFRLITAMASGRPYILFDEPVLGLDARHREMFYTELIRKYSEDPFTAVISTHLISEVADIIEHTVIIRGGKLVRDMPTSELLAGAYTVSGAAAQVDHFIAGRIVLSERRLGGLKTVCIQGSPDREQIPGDMEIGAMGLQDYFISLMGEEEKQ
jgi:ABC-2 type transport system ATP-binding protein